MPMPCLNKTNVELRKRLSRLNKTNVEVEKRMLRLNKRNTEIEKRRSHVKSTNKLNFDRKNAPYPGLVIRLFFRASASDSDNLVFTGS